MRKKRSGNMTLKIVLAAAVMIVLAASLILVLFIKQQQLRRIPDQEAAETAQNPAETIGQLEKALDELDSEAAAACFDTASAETVQTELDNVLGQYGSAVVLMKFAVDFTLQVRDISYTDDTHCTVQTDASVKLPGDENQTPMELPMVVENGKWVIDLTGHPETFAQLETLF